MVKVGLIRDLPAGTNTPDSAVPAHTMIPVENIPLLLLAGEPRTTVVLQSSTPRGYVIPALAEFPGVR